jgi:mannose-6-phosphate isomerase class I
VSLFPRKAQIARLVKAYEDQDEGFATSSKAERRGAAALRRVRDNSTSGEIARAHQEYRKRHGYRPRMGDDGSRD